MHGATTLFVASVLVAGCGEGQVQRSPSTPVVPHGERQAVRPLPPPPAPSAVETHEGAAPADLLGARPATLGRAFDGLALGQEISQQAADAFLQRRGIPARADVRDGHLVSLRLSVLHVTPCCWPSDGNTGEWLDPVLHNHATKIATEWDSFVQFDLEVPIERWLNMTLESIVQLDLVTAPREVVEKRLGRSFSGDVDGHTYLVWIDSALAGAATATHLSLVEVQAYRKTKRASDGGWEIEEIPGQVFHSMYVSLGTSPAIYDEIVQRLTALFGKPVHDRKTNTDRWKRSKLELTHTAAVAGLVNIKLSRQR